MTRYLIQSTAKTSTNRMYVSASNWWTSAGVFAKSFELESEAVRYAKDVRRLKRFRIVEVKR